jgi:hypothetical protein
MLLFSCLFNLHLQGSRWSYDLAQVELKNAVINAKQAYCDAVISHNRAVIKARDAQIAKNAQVAKKRTRNVDKHFRIVRSDVSSRSVVSSDSASILSTADIACADHHSESQQDTLLTQFLSPQAHPVLREACIRLLNFISFYAVGRAYLRLHCIPPILHLNQTGNVLQQLSQIRVRGSILTLLMNVLNNEALDSAVSQQVSFLISNF